MFKNLKYKSGYQSKYSDMPNAFNYHSNPTSSTDSTASFGSPKGNEGSRMVRCRICGFPCDKERDSRSKDGSWAGLGVTYGVQLTAGTSIGDRRVPAAGVISTTVDEYYNITHKGGCPMCGCLTYDL